MASRRGFSLIELLFVIAVIGLLTAIIVVAATNGFATAKSQATQATVKILDAAIGQRINALHRSNLMSTEQIDLVATNFGSLACGNKELAKIFARKDIERRYLPQNWVEASTLLANSGKSAPAIINEATESAEVLYFILTSGDNVGSLDVDADWLNASNTGDTDKNGALEVVDAWRHPIRWYRWPTRLIRPNGIPNTATVAPPLFQGDYDSAKVLMSSMPSFTDKTLVADQDNPLDLGWGMTGFKPMDVESQFHTIDTWHVYLFVSAGPDGYTGMYEPGDAANYGHLARPNITEPALRYDNITNMNTKSGGK